MSNWVTLANGVHIDLDDPNNPVTGDGSYESYLGGGNKGSSGKGNQALKNDIAAAYKEYYGNFHPDNDIIYDLRNSGKNYGMSDKDMVAAVQSYVKEQQDEYKSKLKSMPKTQKALEKDASKWLDGHRDLIKYETSSWGQQGVNGKTMSDLRQAYLKDQFGIEADSYVVDYDTDLSLSRAMSVALDYVWSNEIKEGKRK